MAEEVSPESKLYVKEEIEKSRKEFKDDLEKAQSKATRTFTTIAMVVGLVTGVGVYLSINNAIQNELSNTAIKKLEADANDLHDKIVVHEKDANKILSVFKNDANNTLSKFETDANDILSMLKKFEPQVGEYDGHTWIGGIKIIWGTILTTKSGPQPYEFGHGGFPKACFTVIPSLAGVPHPIPTSDPMNKTHFRFQRRSDLDDYNKGEWLMTFVAIGY